MASARVVCVLPSCASFSRHHHLATSASSPAPSSQHRLWSLTGRHVPVVASDVGLDTTTTTTNIEDVNAALAAKPLLTLFLNRTTTTCPAQLALLQGLSARLSPLSSSSHSVCLTFVHSPSSSSNGHTAFFCHSRAVLIAWKRQVHPCLRLTTWTLLSPPPRPSALPTRLPSSSCQSSHSSAQRPPRKSHSPCPTDPSAPTRLSSTRRLVGRAR